MTAARARTPANSGSLLSKGRDWRLQMTQKQVLDTQPQIRAREFESDTIVIAAREDSFQKVFMTECCWYPVRIDDKRLPALRWIAVYRGIPTSAITHYAQILRIEKFEETGRYRIVFDNPASLQNLVVLGKSKKSSMQGQRYTTLTKLLASSEVSDLNTGVQ